MKKGTIAIGFLAASAITYASVFGFPGGSVAQKGDITSLAEFDIKNPYHQAQVRRQDVKSNYITRLSFLIGDTGVSCKFDGKINEIGKDGRVDLETLQEANNVCAQIFAVYSAEPAEGSVTEGRVEVDMNTKTVYVDDKPSCAFWEHQSEEALFVPKRGNLKDFLAAKPACLAALRAEP